MYIIHNLIITSVLYTQHKNILKVTALLVPQVTGCFYSKEQFPDPQLYIRTSKDAASLLSKMYLHVLSPTVAFYHK